MAGWGLRGLKDLIRQEALIPCASCCPQVNVSNDQSSRKNDFMKILLNILFGTSGRNNRK